MPRALVLGSPIRHSLSPVLHRAAYASLGLTDWTYDACEVDEAGFAAFVAGLCADVCGLSLTMPLKEVAFTVASTVSDRARLAGAINTLVRRDDGGWDADNTDIAGIVGALRGHGTAASQAGGPDQGATRAPGERGAASIRSAPRFASALRARPSQSAAPLSPDPRVAGVRLTSDVDELASGSARPRLEKSPSGLILGAGATARSALIALRDLGCATVIACARNPAKASASLDDLARSLDVELTVRDLRAWPEVAAGLVISTLPGAGALAAAEALTVRGADLSGVVLLDVVYADWPTPLALAAEAAGALVVSGLDMLVHQAVEQVASMTGHRPAAEALFAAVGPA